MSLKTPQHSHRLLKNGRVRPFNVPRKSKEEIKPFQSYPNLTLQRHGCCSKYQSVIMCK